ncbi:hypothetical protein MLD38_036825 [Melastoma candidum]|uniref:Uncharacterized protein n=1 Tax=Melastoma candidum TaxID=119954 RepID=A0ACB9LKX9_9MYRT|nr:hypothetical protein MLD38_036825 [Melastoma candidum]
MLRSIAEKRRKIPKGGGGCGYLCCNYRPSISSPADDELSSGGRSQHHGTISLLAHAMVQERLDQIIRGTEREGQRNRRVPTRVKFVVMVAVEVDSDDPVKDFRVSMAEMIRSNAIEQPKDLRRLLKLYLSVNSKLVADVVLQAFYEVCTYMFLG